MVGDEPKVEIGLREIYDKVLETHGAVTNLVPRLNAVEKTAGDAMEMATSANRRSLENRRFIVLSARGLIAIIGTTILAIIGAWVNKHM